MDQRLADLTTRQLCTMPRRDLEALWRAATPAERHAHDDRIRRITLDRLTLTALAGATIAVIVAVIAFINL